MLNKDNAKLRKELTRKCELVARKVETNNLQLFTLIKSWCSKVCTLLGITFEFAPFNAFFLLTIDTVFAGTGFGSSLRSTLLPLNGLMGAYGQNFIYLLFLIFMYRSGEAELKYTSRLFSATMLIYWLQHVVCKAMLTSISFVPLLAQ